jgi:hypothetical protein
VLITPVITQKKMHKSCIRRGGVTPAFRFQYWYYKLGAEALRTSGGVRCGYVQDLNKECLNVEGLYGTIYRDLSRTFPKLELFARSDGVGQVILASVLKALCKRYPEIGYCQGMNYVVALLLLTALGGSDTCKDPVKQLRDAKVFLDEKGEESIFWCMCGIIEKFDMINIWRPGVPLLKMRVYQVDQLLEMHLPVLYEHFKAIHLAADYFASQWFLTVYAYCVTPNVVEYIWDVLFSEGWKTVFKVGLASLQLIEKELLKFNLEHMSMHLKKNIERERYCASPKILMNEAMKIKVKKSYLTRLERQYKDSVLRRKFEDHPDKELVMFKLKEFDIMINADVMVLRGKIEQAHIDCAVAEKSVFAQEAIALEAHRHLEDVLEKQHTIAAQISEIQARLKGGSNAEVSPKESGSRKSSPTKSGGGSTLHQLKVKFEKYGKLLEQANEENYKQSTELDLVRISLDECLQRKEMLIGLFKSMLDAIEEEKINKIRGYIGEEGNKILM